MATNGDRQTGRATIRDIAAHAGVSITTVSRVLNDRPDVAQETREAVLDVIRELNFAPNRTTRPAPSGRTGLIGVTIPMVLGDYFAQIITGLTEALYELDMQAVLCPRSTTRSARSPCQPAPRGSHRRRDPRAARGVE